MSVGSTCRRHERGGMTAAVLALLLSFGAAYVVQNGSVATAIFRVLPPQRLRTPSGDATAVKKRRHEHDSSSYDEISVETLEQPSPGHHHWTPLVIFLFIAAVLIGMILIILAALFYIRVFRAHIGYQAMKAEESRKDPGDGQAMRTVTYQPQPPPTEAGTQTKIDLPEPKKEGDETHKWVFRARSSDEELKRTLRLKREEEERRRAQKKKEEEEEQRRLLRIKQLEEEQQQRKLKMLEEEARRAKEAEEMAKRAKEAEEMAKRAKEAEEKAKAASEVRPSIKRKKGMQRDVRRSYRMDKEQDDSGLVAREGGRRSSTEISVRKKREKIDIVQKKDQVSLQDDDDGRALPTMSQMRLDLQFKQDSKGKSKCTMKAYVDPPVDGSVTLDTQNDDSPPDDSGNASPASPRPVMFQLQSDGKNAPVLHTSKRRSYDLGNLRKGARKSTELRVTRSASSISSEETNEVEEVGRAAGPSSQPPRQDARHAKKPRRRNVLPEEDKTESSRERPSRTLEQIKAVIEEMIERRGIGE